MPVHVDREKVILGVGAAGVLILSRPVIRLIRSAFHQLRLTRLQLYVLKSDNGVEAHISPFGCIIQRLLVPGRDGVADVVLGFDELYTYEEENVYFGAIVGRVANRIKGAKFTLDGREYRVPMNNGNNALHGGWRGFDKVIWNARPFRHADGDALELTYTSKHGEQGYPGRLDAKVTYIMQPQGTLKMLIEATADRPTPVNIVQHSYFNLAGHDSGDVLNQVLHINGDYVTPKDSEGIPTAEILPVADTPFDFTRQQRIGKCIDEVEGGYDHNYCLFGMGKNAKFVVNNQIAQSTPKLAAQVEDRASGRVLKIYTTAPGVQFYSGNFLNGVRGKDGAVYNKHGALCLETQGFPNAVNEPQFPSQILRPPNIYKHETHYQFNF